MKRIRLYRIRLLVCLLLAAAPAGADIWSQCPPDEDGIDTDGDGIVDNDHICIKLSAGDGFLNMADGRLLYMFGFGNVSAFDDMDVMMAGMLNAHAPAPTLELRQGQKLFLALSNVGMMMRPDLFDPHSVHWHGYANAAPIFDGVPDASAVINMGSTFTYFYEVNEPGTYLWHCHVEATEHMQMGMLGNLFVHPIQNMLPDGTNLNGFTHHTGYTYAYNDGDGSTYYDVDYPIQCTSMDPVFHELHLGVQPLPFAYMIDTYFMLNGRGYPDTVDPNPLLQDLGDLGAEMGLTPIHAQDVSSRIECFQGQKVLLRLSNLSVTQFLTVTVLGLPMRVVGQGARLLRSPEGVDLSYETTSVTFGGGESKDVILDTSQAAGPGRYFLYTTNLNYLSNDTQDFGGLMTEIVVNVPPGRPLGRPANIKKAPVRVDPGAVPATPSPRR
jgi:FtsP/CotA-like multicopper oxidase with cupredoxin domain